MMGSDLPHLGVQAHIVEAAFSHSNINVEFAFYPPVRVFEYARTGQLDGLVGWVHSTDREALFTFTEPYLESPLVFFHHKHIPFDWQEMADLKGHTVGLVTKNHYGQAFHQAAERKVFDIEYTALDEANFRKLYIGRITLFPYNRYAGYNVLSKNLPKAQARMITHHPKPLKHSAYHVLISKQTNKHQALAKKFNEGLKAIRQSGLYNTILRQHNMNEP